MEGGGGGGRSREVKEKGVELWKGEGGVGE